ncbi:MAG: hypothetical protein IPK03_02520 [Bacteroidetes bacterium]|nr:hypothetical protein [Bacteroidota bacterium]
MPFKVIRTPRPSRDTIFYCAKGGSREIRINKLDSGVTFDWSHHSGFTSSNADSSIVKIALTHDTTYYIHYTYFGGVTCPTCNMIDTIVLKYVPDFTHTISPVSPKVCINIGATININADSIFKPYTYTWSPIKQLFNPMTGAKHDSASSITASTIQIKPFQNSTYFVDITAKNGCTVRDSVNIQVVDSVPNIGAYAPKSAWCNCDTAKIYAIGNQFASCGVQTYPNNNPLISVPLSASTTSFPIKPMTDYPSVFGASQGKNAKHRILIKNSELKALGIQGKNLRSFSLFTDTVNENKYKKVRISMACSQADTLAANINPIQVFYRDSLILLSNVEYKFILDGFGYNLSYDDHLFIDFCFENDTTALENAQFKTENTPFNSVAYLASNASICNQNSFSNYSNIRPVMHFGIRQPKIVNPININWSPNIGLSNNSIANPIVNRCASIQYTLTATNGICQSSDTIKINIDTISFLQARADTFICSSLPVELYAIYNANPLPFKTTNFQWTSIPTDTSLKFPNQINQVVRPAQTTTYILKMSGGACDKYDTVKITRGAPLNLSMNKKDPTCSGANGRAVVKTNNGIGPFTYTWNPSNINDDTIKNIIPGKYKVTVQAADGCLGNDSITLNNIIQTPSLALTKQNVRCFNEANGSAKVKVNSAETGPFQYTWIPTNTNKDSIFNLAAGWYSVTVLDTPSNCTARDSILITQPSKLSIDADSVDVLCNGNNTGSLSTNTTGGTRHIPILGAI